MSTRKIIFLAVILPTLGATVYSIKYNGKPCGGPKANEKEFICPKYYQCVLESNKPMALGVCRFMPNGLNFDRQEPTGNQVTETPAPRDTSVQYDIDTKKAQKLTLAHNRFGFELLKILSYGDESRTKNILISPVGLNLMLDALFTGANTYTKDQMADVLHVNNLSMYQVNEASRILLDRLHAPVAGVTMNISNSTWIKQGLTLSDLIVKDGQAHYGAYVTNIDFNQPESSQTINNWVYGNTAGKISNMITGPIDTRTTSYVVDTAYFNSIWKYKFDPEKTQEREFNNQNGNKPKIKFMTMEMGQKEYNYFENDLFQALDLPFGANGKYSMVILLPKNITVDELLGKFDTVNWDNWLSQFKNRRGLVYLPKLRIAYENSLNEPLKAIGLVSPFDPEKADFTKVTADGKNNGFFINNLLHKTLIEVTEEGLLHVLPTPTPTASPYWAAPSPPPEELPFTMDINKPFFYSIYNNEVQSNIMLGIVRGF